jgi:hypothetical protein
LEFERQWWRYAGAKEQAIRELFDMSATRYYQIVNNLIDTHPATGIKGVWRDIEDAHHHGFIHNNKPAPAIPGGNRALCTIFEAIHRNTCKIQ